MTRIHSHNRGKSMHPTFKSTPHWVTYSSDEIVMLIIKFGKEGLGPSEIGRKLRDEYSIPSVNAILGKDILDVLKQNNLAPETPEDLDRLLKRAVILHNHLKANKGDRKNVRSLELLEAKIHRISKYYKRKGILEKSWKYAAVVAQLS